MNNYTNLLREHHLKATPQRLAITESLYNSGHMNIESLYQVMIQKFHSISLATIYKNINLMIENSFIQEVKIPNQKSVYELKKESHSHIVCEKCYHIQDVSIDLSEIVENSALKTHYTIQSADLVLNGICQKCQEKNHF